MTNHSLLLLFTRNVSLKQWVESGLFFREKLLYEKLLAEGILESVTWSTYGDPSDKLLAEDLKSKGSLDPRIQVITKPSWWAFGNLLYSFLMEVVHLKTFKENEFIKSNQLDGSWVGTAIKRHLPAKKFILRSGYNLLFFLQRERNNLKYVFYKFQMSYAVKFADRIIVTSEDHRNYFLENFKTDPQLIKVIGNYIDTDAFKPSQLNLDGRMIYLARFEEMKNVLNLVDAAIESKISLDLVGKGSLEPQIHEKIKNYSNIRLLGTFHNDQIPDLFKGYTYFILPSHYEGNPKALLEAMSSGLVCLGTMVPGIKEILIDGLNGITIPSTDVNSLTETFQRIKFLNDAQLQEMSKNARQYIELNHSLDMVVKKESVFAGY